MGAVQKIDRIEWKNKIKSNTSFVNSTILLYFLFSLQYMMQIDMFFKQALGLMSEKEQNKSLEVLKGLLHFLRKDFLP